MFTNTMPRFEPLREEEMEAVDQGWRRIVSELGIRFDHPDAIALFRAAGQDVDDDVVRFDPDFMRRSAAQAPAQFELRARNPACATSRSAATT